jgi:hypothetical protein
MKKLFVFSVSLLFSYGVNSQTKQKNRIPPDTTIKIESYYSTNKKTTPPPVRKSSKDVIYYNILINPVTNTRDTIVSIKNY